MLRVLIAAGGTGGHVIPALHVAIELRKRGHEVLFVGTARGLESRLVPEKGFALETLEIGGLNRVGLATLLKNLARLPLAVLDAWRIVGRFRPDVAYGVGAYISGPVLLAAKLRGIPIVVHEANAVPGFANRRLAPMVSRALLTDAAASRFFPASRVSIVGLPVNDAFFHIAPKAHQPPYTVLVTGGSQGSSRMNRAVVDALPLLDGIQMIHQTGPREHDAIRKSYPPGYSGDVCAFIADMPTAMSRADLIVSRAGASTLAEIAAAGKAALLVPFPFASDDHQLHNAEARERAGAARLLRDADLSGPRLAAEIQAMLPGLSAIEINVRKFAVPDATARIADALEGAAA